MIHLLSPAKSLNFEKSNCNDYTIPLHLDQSQKVIKKMRTVSGKKLGEMMSISKALVKLNRERYQDWTGTNELNENSKQAIFAFSGDVYLGLEANSLDRSSIDYSQDHLRILSGAYGLLKPLDLIEAYRLEMGTSIKIGRRKNLYDFWSSIISKDLNEDLEKQDTPFLINLASNEYFKAVDQKKIKAEIISPQFLDEKNGQFKVLSFFAKKARGMMSRFILENRIDQMDDILAFDSNGYRYNADLSNKDKPVFTRPESWQA